MHILITAFEPFGGEAYNSSANVLALLPDRIGDHTMEKLMLPVVFGEAGKIVLAHPADYVFLLGEASGRKKVTPEMYARNVRNARIPDNRGLQPVNEAIFPGGPAQYETRVPVTGLVGRMQSDGYGIEVSRDAGAFVCNDTFYLVGTGSSVPVVFIHVPHEAGRYDQTVLRFIELAVKGEAAYEVPVKKREDL